MRSMFVGLCAIALAGCVVPDLGESSIPAGHYSAIFAELSANNWSIAPANYRGETLVIGATIGADGFPVVSGQSVSGGQTIQVTMGDIVLSEKILSVNGVGDRVTVSYSGTITEGGISTAMSGGYIVDWTSGWDLLSYDEAIYVGTSIPNEARATRIIRIEGGLRRG